MSKNAGRKQRWTQQNARTYISSLGRVAYVQDAWHAFLEYKTLGPSEREGGLASWLSQTQQLGPFKRPRNAMVALEREATLLKNRHGNEILFGDQPWAEA